MNRTLTRLLALFIIVLMVGCASVPRPSVLKIEPSAPPYDAWARVLVNHVDEQGRVDFAGVARDRTDLDQFVAYIYDYGPNNLPKLFPTPAHVLAYHINAYNALAMHKVVQTGIPKTLAGPIKVGFFALGKVQVGGVPISLYDYENKVIRALGEARIHMALNCMSVGCPRLPREVFTPERVETQLQRETVRFFNEARNVHVSHADRTVWYSEILKFYRSDFLAQAESLAAYVNRFRDVPVPHDYAEKFIDYDWTINRQP